MMKASTTEDQQQLIDLNCELLTFHLQRIVAQRAQQQEKGHRRGRFMLSRILCAGSMRQITAAPVAALQDVPIHEVTPVIDFAASGSKQPLWVDELDEEISKQLRDFVEVVAANYHSNPFHDFAHATHVAHTVAMMVRSCVGDSPIANDSLTQFAMVFSALIHDVDHLGVPNATLVKEHAQVAEKYDNQSVAEQNSVDLALEMFSQDRFQALRSAVCDTPQDQTRFRQLVVNAVMATDICNTDLKVRRNLRWDEVFGEHASSCDDVNRKATSVIEHILQIADVSHTMQSFETFLKWNERLFLELSRAFLEGRADKDPADFWFSGEIGFFTFYIIPQAEKLVACGILGGTASDYVRQAQSNCATWKEKGEELIVNMKKRRDEDLLPPVGVDLPHHSLHRNIISPAQA